MKGLYEKNKKLFIGIVTGICIVICVLIAAIIGFAGNKEESSKKKEGTIQTTTDVSDVEQMDEVTRDAIDEVSMEAVTTEALEIVEDSPLDVVESTEPSASPSPMPSGSPSPMPSGSPTPTPSVMPTPTPTGPVMAQNVPFPYEIHVNKQMNCITVYAMDTSGAYSIPLKAMVCSTGAATPLGTYKTPAKYIWKVLKGNVWGQYSTRISGSILFHSVPYSTNSKSALISKYYNKLGTTASAGCVRLTTADAKWIYDNCPLGTTVHIYNSSNPGPLGKPTAIKVPAGNKWDPTDPDPANPWRNKIARIEGVQNRTVERGNGFDLMTGVSATDGTGVNLTGSISLSGYVDFNTAGVYSVHYSVTGQSGTTVTADATINVVDTKSPVFTGVKGLITGKKASEVTRAMLMEGVSVTDNGMPFDLNAVEVQIPALQDGDNYINYVAQDAVGNRTTVTMKVYCDMKAPVITKNANAERILPLSKTLDAAAILQRITVQDSSGTNITYTTQNEAWGYKIDYVVSDSYGNVSTFTDHVNYAEYQFVGNTKITVSDINNVNELKSSLSLRDSFGNSMALPDSVQVITVSAGDKYKATYNYTYSSPVGSKTATFERIVIVGE